MARPVELDLDQDDVVDAALAILGEDGFDGLSMRTVAARLGVSPVPVYSRVGNKQALLDAVADRVLVDATPVPSVEEEWVSYAARWAHALRDQLRSVPDLSKLLAHRRSAYVGSADVLVGVLRSAGVDRDDAVRAARLLMWSLVGFVIIEGGAVRTSGSPRRRGRKAGGDPAGVTSEDGAALFEQHLGYVLDGLAKELA